MWCRFSESLSDIILNMTDEQGYINFLSPWPMQSLTLNVKTKHMSGLELISKSHTLGLHQLCPLMSHYLEAKPFEDCQSYGPLILKIFEF